MAGNIVVTATGILSALGTGREAHLDALRKSRHGLRSPEILQTAHSGSILLGEVPFDNHYLAAQLGLDPEAHAVTRTTILSLLALQNLLARTGKEILQDGAYAFINASTVGGMCSVEHMYPDFIAEGSEGDYLRFINTLDCAESTENAISFMGGARPAAATISTACSSSANSVILGARMIRNGLVKRAICGGCDALSRFTVNGFLALKNMDTGLCRPFDRNRNGLNLGEGAGYLLLETEEDARARGAAILAVISGYCNSNDAYHPTAPSPNGEGALRTMRQALDTAGLRPDDISYINAHGTATLSNDLAEGKAIETLFGAGAVPYSSTKPYTGHTLAAAGAIESIFSIWALNEGIIYPNLNFSDRMEELESDPVKILLEQQPLQHIMSNSFGFGGNNVSLIFSRS